jgi:hypothetical protein
MAFMPRKEEEDRRWEEKEGDQVQRRLRRGWCDLAQRWAPEREWEWGLGQRKCLNCRWTQR